MFAPTSQQERELAVGSERPRNHAPGASPFRVREGETGRDPQGDLSSFLGMPALICSPRMRDLLSTAERVARSSAAVLIAGESGSGKELVARAIHQFSLRCTKPWIDLNCGALPDHLLESELFGYEKGAFSGAEAGKPGMFELAHQGTLFLDEVGELEPKMQVKLLRVLDGVPYYRLGGTKKTSVDVRIIAATNKSLEDAVRDGRFRGDLYHRLNQVRLRVPPLRERPEDVEALAVYFLRAHDARFHLSGAAQAAIRRYDWPGNVRELRNALTSAALLAADFEIQQSDLPPAISGAEEAPPGESKFRLDGNEQQIIFKALAETGGRQDKAAELLGISRRTLIRKLKTYGERAAAEMLPQPAAEA